MAKEKEASVPASPPEPAWFHCWSKGEHPVNVLAANSDEAVAKFNRVYGIVASPHKVHVSLVEGYEPTTAELDREALFKKEDAAKKAQE